METKTHYSPTLNERRRNILALKTDFTSKRRFNSPEIPKLNIRADLEKNKSSIKIKGSQITDTTNNHSKVHQEYANLLKVSSRNQLGINNQKQSPPAHFPSNQPLQPYVKAVSTNFSVTSQSRRDKTDSNDHKFITSSDKSLKPQNNNPKIYNNSNYFSSPAIEHPKTQQPSIKIIVREQKFKSQPVIESLNIIEVSSSEKDKEEVSNTSVVIQSNDMQASSVIQSFKTGQLRKCLSVQFQKIQEKKMKLKDYLYLNSISGRGKKVEVSANKVSQMSRPGNPHPYMRVREFSKDEAIEKKIKSEIEKNVRSIKERISILEDMNGFNGDKLMLHKLNCILQEKMGKACDEMQSLLLQYEEKLI